MEPIFDLLEEDHGFRLTEIQKRNIKAFIKYRIEHLGLSDENDYYKLIFGSQREKEFRLIFDEITIQETDFFRNADHFKILHEKLLPQMVIEKGLLKEIPSINILSAGCATGEEAYSIAMVVKNFLDLTGEDYKFNIVAVDISTRALKHAREGVYTEERICRIPKKYQKNIYEDEGKYLIKNSLKKNINFKYCNILDYPFEAFFDIVFCRNVTIYLNKEFQKKAVLNLYRYMKDDAFIFIGHSESLSYLRDYFKMFNFNSAIVYQKK